MMTPRPRFGCRNDAGGYGVEREVPGDLQEVVVAIDEQAAIDVIEKDRLASVASQGRAMSATVPRSEGDRASVPVF